MHYFFRRRNKWALVKTNKRHLFNYVDVEGAIFKLWILNGHFQLSFTISKQVRSFCRYFTVTFTLLPINFLIGPLDGAVISCVFERMMHILRQLMWRISMPIHRLRSPDNGGWCLIIAHLLNFHWILWWLGPQAGADISCVQERIMLPIRLLIWRKIMPIYRLQSPSAFYRQSRKIFYNCTFTSPPLLEFSDRAPCWLFPFPCSGKNNA